VAPRVSGLPCSGSPTFTEVAWSADPFATATGYEVALQTVFAVEGTLVRLDSVLLVILIDGGRGRGEDGLLAVFLGKARETKEIVWAGVRQGIIVNRGVVAIGQAGGASGVRWWVHQMRIPWCCIRWFLLELWRCWCRL
jgi:hypothetical protein